MAISGHKVNDEDIISAIKKNDGIIMHAADELNCSRNLIYNRINENKEIEELVQKCREEGEKKRRDHHEVLKKKSLESAEDLLDKRDVATTIFLLKSLGKLDDGSRAFGNHVMAGIDQLRRDLAIQMSRDPVSE